MKKIGLILLGLAGLALFMPAITTAQITSEAQKGGDFSYIVEFSTPWRGETHASLTQTVYIPIGYPSVTGPGVPEGFDNIYPLWFAGDTLNFCLTMEYFVPVGGSAKSMKIYGDTKVEMYQEYLSMNIDGAIGAPIGTANMQAWNIPGPFKPGQSRTVCGSFTIPSNASVPALAQTHIRFSKGTLADSNPKNLIVEDFMSSIWTFMKP